MAITVLTGTPGQAHYFGLSTDTKPSPISGYSFRETDTNLLYLGNGSSWIQATNVTEIKALSNFPTPVAGSITLADNTVYKIYGNVDIGSNRIIMGSTNSIIGNSRLNDRLRASTLTGSLFTSTNQNVVIQNISLSCISGSLFSFVSGNLLLNNVPLVSVKNGGTFNALSSTAFRNVASSGQISNQGFIFSGSCGSLEIVDGLFENNTGTFIDLDSSTFNSITISRNRFLSNSGQTILTGLTGSLNINSGGGGRIGLNSFRGSGSYVSNIQKSDLLWTWHNNTGIANSVSQGGCYMTNNGTATTFTAINTPTKVLGTTSADITERFTMSADNRLTYIGIQPITAFVSIALAVKKAGGGVQDIKFHVYKNGSADTPPTIARTSIKQSGDLENMNCQGFISLVTNDYVELWVENSTSTQSITVDTMNLSII